MGKAIRCSDWEVKMNGDEFARWLAEHEPTPDDGETETATREYSADEWTPITEDEVGALPTYDDDCDTEEIDVAAITQEAARIAADNPLATGEFPPPDNAWRMRWEQWTDDNL